MLLSKYIDYLCMPYMLKLTLMTVANQGHYSMKSSLSLAHMNYCHQCRQRVSSNLTQGPYCSDSRAGQGSGEEAIAM